MAGLEGSFTAGVLGESISAPLLFHRCLLLALEPSVVGLVLRLLAKGVEAESLIVITKACYESAPRARFEKLKSFS